MEWKIECDELSANGLTVKGIRIYSNSTEKETLASLDTLKYGAELFAKMQLEYDKIDKIVKSDVKSNKVVEHPCKNSSLQEKFKEANQKLNEYFDKCAYERLVYKLKTNSAFYYRMKKLFSKKSFINDIVACIESEKITAKVKRNIRYFMEFGMYVPEFIFTNMGKIYEDSEDKGNDKLWGYLTMICKYFFKKSNEVIGCIEMAKRIYSLMLDAIGEASSVYKDDEEVEWD
jgi:hypothetical protein